MASSSYYYNLYKQKKSAVSTYTSNLKSLQKILDSLKNDMGSKINAVNNEIDDLKEDLNKGVRHNSVYTSRANALSGEKEKSASSDPKLSNAIREMEEEISRVNTLKNQAESDKNYYYQKYQAAKEKERQEALEALKAKLSL